MRLFPGLVDSHCHFLSLESKGLGPPACIEEFFLAGGEGLLDVAVGPSGWDRRKGWASLDPRIRLTAGIHPSEAPVSTLGHFEEIEVQAGDPLCVAIGEIGLDWFRGRDHERAQRSLFQDQLVLAGRRGLPVVIHNRAADRELIEDLDAVGWTGTGIQHCFSSDRSFARQALDRGFLLSFAGNLTYPTAANLRDVAAWAPLDRLLVETDAPYLAPQSVRGKPNRPAHAGLTALFLAEIRGLAVETVLEAVGANFSKLFGLALHVERKSDMDGRPLSEG